MIRFRLQLILLVFFVVGTASAFVARLPSPSVVRRGTSSSSTNSATMLFVAETDTDTVPPTPGVSCSGEKIAVVGATGYIGKAVVRESLRRGYPTTAVVRPGSNADATMFTGSYTKKNTNIFEPTATSIATATDTESSLAIKRFDVSDQEACSRSTQGESQNDNNDGLFEPGSVDVVVCCLASRNGTPREAFAIDYRAALNVAEAAKEAGARRFVLLSAYCVKSAELKEPHALQFQYAKKKLELALAEMSKSDSDCSDNNNNPFSYVAIRPTAFFKSVSGQLETVQAGGPFILFDLGAGKTAACNPISEDDLASALIDQVVDDTHKNTHWNLGGPDTPGLDKMDQMNSMTEVLGFQQQPRLIYVPIGVLHFFVNSFQWLADVFRSDKLNDAAELARIVRYYAIEDMLTTSPDEKYGTMTTRQHYEYIAKNGQEYDPYTSAYGILKDRERILDDAAAVVAEATTTSAAVDEKVAMEGNL